MSDSSVNPSNKNVFVVVLVLCSPRIIRFARVGMCAAMTRNFVKRLANQKTVLTVYIGQSDNYVKLLTEQSIYSQSTDDCLCYPTSEDTKKQTTTTDCKERRREDVF